jgi:hypothetical protein
VLGRLARWVWRRLRPGGGGPGRFPGSGRYWEERYASGGDSGAGSYGKLARFKAEVLNRFVAEHAVRSVIEFGCGDGNQLALAEYPSYLGFDVSDSAVALCSKSIGADANKTCKPLREYDGETADLALSLDVLYHLVEPAVFERYMRTLFGASTRFVIVYSTNTDDNAGFEGTHVRHRRFTDWIDERLPGWNLMRHVPNRYPDEGDLAGGSAADFFVYEKSGVSKAGS